MKILITIPKGYVFDTFFTPDVQQRFSMLGDVEYYEGNSQMTTQQLCDALEGVDVAVTGWGSPQYTEQVLKKADKLQLVAHVAGSVYGIVSDALYERGIRVMSANRLFAQSTAEGAFTYMLCGLRRIEHYAAQYRLGKYKEPDFYNNGLLEKKVGLVGFGQVARFVRSYLRPFGCEVYVSSPEVDATYEKEYDIHAASLEEIFTNCDVVSIHASLTEGTYHLIGRELLSKLKPGAVLVNSARGAIMDEQALAEAAKSGKFYAVLDVTEEEPCPMDSGLRNLDNVTLIPHMGGPTIDRRRNCALAVADDIERFCKGEKLRDEITREYALTMTQPGTNFKK